MRSGSNLSSQGPAPSNYDEWIEFARTATHGWHDEERLYPYDNPHFEEAWGHFTQMVWRNTTRVGCAVGHCGPDVEFPGRFYCCKCVWLLLREDTNALQTTTMPATTSQRASSRNRSGLLPVVILPRARRRSVQTLDTTRLAPDFGLSCAKTLEGIAVILDSTLSLYHL
jgi:hypothetical protein